MRYEGMKVFFCAAMFSDLNLMWLIFSELMMVFI